MNALIALGMVLVVVILALSAAYLIFNLAMPKKQTPLDTRVMAQYKGGLREAQLVKRGLIFTRVRLPETRTRYAQLVRIANWNVFPIKPIKEGDTQDG